MCSLNLICVIACGCLGSYHYNFEYEEGVRRWFKCDIVKNWFGRNGAQCERDMRRNTPDLKIIYSHQFNSSWMRPAFVHCKSHTPVIRRKSKMFIFGTYTQYTQIHAETKIRQNILYSKLRAEFFNCQRLAVFSHISMEPFSQRFKWKRIFFLRLLLQISQNYIVCAVEVSLSHSQC